MIHLPSVLIVSLLSLLPTIYAKCPSEPNTLPDLVYLGVLGDGNCAIEDGDGSKCDIYLRMAPNDKNDSFVDFYLEGSAEGWVAVGFSYNTDMVETDVVGCKRDKDGSLGIVNSWNPNVNPKHNEIDPNQNLMCSYDIEYKEKRIMCHFSRYAGVINAGYDFDFNDSFHLILGRSDNQSPVDDSFPIHTTTPSISNDQINVYTYESNSSSNGTSTKSNAFKLKMKKAHGSFMLISWLMFAGTGIFFAMWMKPALIGGLWFQLHRIFMVLSVVLELVGFICIFIGMKDNKPRPGLLGFECPIEIVHFVFGIIVTIGMLANPVIGLVRCGHDSPNRWLFNLSHGLVGGGLWILALINIALGLVLFQHPCGSNGSYYIVKVYGGWLGFLILAHVIMYILFTMIAITSTGPERYELAPSIVKRILKSTDDSDEYARLNTNETNTESEHRTFVYGKDVILRRAAFGIYTGVNFIVVIILVALIGES